MSPPLCHSWRTDSQCRLRHVCWGNKTPRQLLCFLFCVTVFPPRVLVFSFSLWLTAHALPPSDLTFWLFSSFIILSGFSPSFGLFHSLHIFPASTVLRQKHLQPVSFFLLADFVFPEGSVSKVACGGFPIRVLLASHFPSLFSSSFTSPSPSSYFPHYSILFPWDSRALIIHCNL